MLVEAGISVAPEGALGCLDWLAYHGLAPEATLRRRYAARAGSARAREASGRRLFRGSSVHDLEEVAREHDHLDGVSRVADKHVSVA